MRSIAISAILITAIGSFPGPVRADEPRGDLGKLQGNWITKIGPNKDLPISLNIKESKFDLKLTRPDGQEVKLKADLKINEKADPKTFDLTNIQGSDAQEIGDILGIYKLEGDSWTTCSGGPGNDRPGKFEVGQGGPPNLSIWTRVKDKADEKPLPGDLARFQGTWLAPAGPNDEVMITMTVKVNNYTARWDAGDGTRVEIKGEMRVNEKATPNKTIDFFHSQRNDGENARDNLGIYDFDGDKIKICVGGGGNERPTEFKKGESGLPLLLIFTKQKD